MGAVEREFVPTPAKLADVTLAVRRFLQDEGKLPPPGGGEPPAEG